MKIGILTFTDGTNIGQRLQNFALQQALEELTGSKEIYTVKQGFPFNTFRRDMRKMLNRLKHPAEMKKQDERQKRFDAFNRNHVRFYDRELPFHGDNSSFAKDFDAFIVGSDQIWNPNSPFVGDNFFLTFAKEHQRMTYAPSFSAEEIPEDKVELYRGYLNGFPTITVREDKGAEIVKAVSGKDVEVVLDPTLLLKRSDYDAIKAISDKKPDHPYILSMFLGEYPAEGVQEIAESVGISVLRLDSDAVIGPDEFLDLVENAEIVLTDSYHITIFSILYHRPFVNFMRSGAGAAMSSRFDTLYRLLGIEGRTWNELKGNMEKIPDMEYSEIEKHLQIERARCRNILKTQLEAVRV